MAAAPGFRASLSSMGQPGDPHSRVWLYRAAERQLQEPEVAACLSHVLGGGRLVVVAGRGPDARRQANELLALLQVRIRVMSTAPGRDEYRPFGAHPGGLTDWTYLRGARSATLAVRPPARGLAGSSESQIVLAVDRPAAATCGMPGCDVVVCADPTLLVKPVAGGDDDWNSFMDGLLHVGETASRDEGPPNGKRED